MYAKLLTDRQTEKRHVLQYHNLFGGGENFRSLTGLIPGLQYSTLAMPRENCSLRLRAILFTGDNHWWRHFPPTISSKWRIFTGNVSPEKLKYIFFRMMCPFLIFCLSVCLFLHTLRINVFIYQNIGSVNYQLAMTLTNSDHTNTAHICCTFMPYLAFCVTGDFCGRSILHCCWSTPVEQSTTSSPWLWTIAFKVSPVTKNAFVWLKIAAPSDLLLNVVRFTNVLTYLLTYLLTVPVHLMRHTEVLLLESATPETVWTCRVLWRSPWTWACRRVLAANSPASARRRPPDNPVINSSRYHSQITVYTSNTSNWFVQRHTQRIPCGHVVDKPNLVTVTCK